METTRPDSRSGLTDAGLQTQYKVLRVWGFGDVNTLPDPNNGDPNKVYFQVLNSTGSYINFGADGLQRLDYAVSSAEKHGVKLVLNFINNWNDCQYHSFSCYTSPTFVLL